MFPNHKHTHFYIGIIPAIEIKRISKTRLNIIKIKILFGLL